MIYTVLYWKPMAPMVLESRIFWFEVRNLIHNATRMGTWRYITVQECFQIIHPTDHNQQQISIYSIRCWQTSLLSLGVALQLIQLAVLPENKRWSFLLIRTSCQDVLWWDDSGVIVWYRENMLTHRQGCSDRLTRWACGFYLVAKVNFFVCMIAACLGNARAIRIKIMIGPNSLELH